MLQRDYFFEKAILFVYQAQEAHVFIGTETVTNIGFYTELKLLFDAVDDERVNRLGQRLLS